MSKGIQINSNASAASKRGIELAAETSSNLNDWSLANTAAQQDDSPSPAMYGRILWRNKWAVLSIALLSAFVAIIATLPQTPRYQARTTLEIQSLNQNFLDMGKLSPVQQAGGDSVNPLGDIPTQIEIIESQSITDRTATHFDPNFVSDRQRSQQQSQSFASSLVQRLVSLFTPSKLSTSQKALKYAVESLKAKPVPETNVVEIVCESTDPKLAADYLNILTDEYIKQTLEVRWTMNRRTQEYLTTQLDAMREKLESSEAALQSNVRNAGLIVASDNGSKFSEDQLRNVQGELNRAQADRAVQEARYNVALHAPAETLADVVDNQQLRNYQSKMTDLRQELADLSPTFTAGAPKVLRVQAQLAEVQASFEHERDAVIRRIANDFEQSKRRESLLLSQYSKQASRVSSDAQRSIQYSVLNREVETNRHLYEATLAQVREATIASAIGASNIHVIDLAERPTIPSKPMRALYAVFGLFFGFSVGAGIVLTRTLSDRSIQAPEDASQYLGLPELGVIPAMVAPRGGLFGQPRKQRQGPTLLRVPPQSADSGLSASLAVEPFRAALTSILFSKGLNQPKVVVVASVNPGEGKTFVTAQLASTLAESGQRVLVVDADMRSPQMHKIFNVSNKSGFSTILSSPQSESAPDVSTFASTSGIPNLAVLPGGPVSIAGTGLLYSPRLAELIQSVRGSYDFVLIDTPPLLAIPDARVIGRLSDGVVLVIRSRRTSRDDVRSVCQRLNEDGTRIVGTILNDWDSSSGRSSRYGYPQPYEYARQNGHDNL